jgi:hypothetical protein
MNERSIRFGIFVSALAIMSMIFSTLSSAAIIRTPVVKVVTIKEALVMSDKERINLFIDELLTPRSAKCFKAILMAESNMRPNALNKSSGAMGVGQLLGETYQNIGLKHSNDGLAQVVASLAYISRHYGSSGTCAALKAEQTKHSY